MSFDSFYRSLGIKTDEVRTVGLFFLHHFFLGFGTMLIYVSANVILLENHPETSLPYAYMASAVGMIIIGKIYAYFEHHLPLNQLVVRVLWAVVLLTATILALVAYGHSTSAAVAIMVGFRGIYLLTNLEFWGLSAVVFDVRQSKRLFGVISAGDMPAKALGGMLAVLIHNHTELVFLLLLAFVFFLAAMYTVVFTFRSQPIQPERGRPRTQRKAATRLVVQLFGGSELIFAMCLSMTAIAVMATGVEYAFFVNVKYKLHSQAEVLTYLGGVLTLTYLLATFVKLVVSRQTIERFGLNRVLALLPLGGLGAVVVLGSVFYFKFDESVQLLAYCLVYLGFEVVRRALFDPVFLVLFQPLSTHQRLQGHTLVKGFYEPLGLGIGGLMLYLSHHFWKSGQWFLVEEIVIGALLALWFLQRTYQQYVRTLQHALSRRFVMAEDLAIPQEATEAVLRNLDSKQPREVVNAVEWLVSNQGSGMVSSPRLHQSIEKLLAHPNNQIRQSAIEAAEKLNITFTVKQLRNIALEDNHPPIREIAASLVSRQAENTGEELLYYRDLMVRKGAIKGLLGKSTTHKSAITSLEAMLENNNLDSQLAGLQLIQSLQLRQYAAFVRTNFGHSNAQIATAAIETAATLSQSGLAMPLVELLHNNQHWRTAAHSLARLEQEAVVAFRDYPKQNAIFTRRVVATCGQMQSAEAYQLLTEFAQKGDVSLRTLALQALRNFSVRPTQKIVFEKLLQNELTLAQHLLHGQAQDLDQTFKNSLQYEQEAMIGRIFGLLMQLYDQDVIISTQTSVLHSSRERRANSLELLENIVPRQVYGSLHTLLDEVPTSEKIRQIETHLGAFTPQQSIQYYVLQTGTRFFTDWTIRLSLRGLPPEILFQYPDLQLMNHHSNTAVSITERVMVLKNTDLFGQTPENVLSSIAPIMKEVRYTEGQTIFEKGDFGNSMFVIYEGEVAVMDSNTQLASFGRGEVFGELALLDAEPRSAAVVAQTDVQLFRIDQADFYDLMDERGEVLRNIIKMLCQRLRTQNTKLRALATS